MKKLLSYQVKLLAIAAVLLMNFSGILSAKAQIDTIAIIDGGSSGSRLYVYAVDKSSKTVNCIYPVSKLEQDASKGQALSTLESNPDKVKTFLNTMTAKYDNRNKPTKRLYILATAGMRLEDSTKVRAIYSYMANITTPYNYKVENAMTISGQYEGLYAWIAVNLGAGNIGTGISAPEKTPTYIGTPYGIIEIGGASLQITFAANQEYDKTISRKGFSNIYSKSYLGGGLNKFRDKSNEFRDKSNKEVVIAGLNAIKTFCGSIEFFEIGWAFNDLMKDNSPENEAKRQYVRDVTNALKYKKAVPSKSINPSWTEGAAFDIVINEQYPQPFDYARPN